MNNTSKNEINVEANLPVVAGELRPWKRGSLLSAASRSSTRRRRRPAGQRVALVPAERARRVIDTHVAGDADALAEPRFLADDAAFRWAR